MSNLLMILYIAIHSIVFFRSPVIQGWQNVHKERQHVYTGVENKGQDKQKTERTIANYKVNVV
jgi:hypothetical protein